MRTSPFGLAASCLLLGATAFGAVLSGACGGTTSDPTAPAPVDTGTGQTEPAQPKKDAGVVSEPDDPLNPKYPAPHTPMPAVDYNGGRVIANPKIVTVTFPGDSLRPRLEDFGDTITSTPWWDAVTAEYCDSTTRCVGRGSGGGHVVMPSAALASYTDDTRNGPSTIQQMIMDRILDHTLPEPTQDTLYAFYFPSSTKITLSGDPSCQSFGAYHNTLPLTQPADAGAGDGGAWPKTVAYAIMPRCGGEYSVTTSASHEFAEAVTDPDIGIGHSDVAYYMNDPAWAAQGGETADLCVAFNGDDSMIESGFRVQRSWSNLSAGASHDPCVPTPAGKAYFNTALPKQEFSLKVGQSITITLASYSDAPTPAWGIRAIETSHFSGGSSSLELTLDRTKAHNGSKPKLTIKMVSEPSRGYAPFAVVNESPDGTHYWGALVVTQ